MFYYETNYLLLGACVEKLSMNHIQRHSTQPQRYLQLEIFRS
ncbi:hypothetical protein FM109_14885 [Vibrio casei]|nr:hypothetical protein FM109_14885 [Vibrio casei]